MDHLFLRIISELLLPPFSPFLLLLVAFLLYANHWKRSGAALAFLACAAMFFLSLVGVENMVRSPWPAVPTRVAPPYPQADAIVVLGAGRYLDAPEYDGDTAAAGSLERVRYAAKLHRETRLPVLVSGGRPGSIGTRAEAEIMRDILELEFSVPVRWVESNSEDTQQNAERSAELLRAGGVKRIFLVTHGFHMDRAAEEFRKHGLDIVPMATGFVRPQPETALSWLPSFEGVARNRGWVYEKLAGLKPF